MVNDEVTAIDTKARRVETGSGGVDYDYLIVSLGAELRRSQQVAGLEAPWELDDALAARERLAGLDEEPGVDGSESCAYRWNPAPFEAAGIDAALPGRAARSAPSARRSRSSTPGSAQWRLFGPLIAE